MANAGKKRAAAGKGSTTSSKKVKLANKKASSKTGGKTPKNDRPASKQKQAAGDSDGFKSSLRNEPKKQSKSKDGLIKDKKGKHTIKEFVDGPVLGQGEDDDDDASLDGSDIDVADMLHDAPDSSEDETTPADAFSKRAAFLTAMNPKELAKSRAFLQQQHRTSKPTLPALNATASTSRVPLPKIPRAEVNVNSDDEENLDELDEDDFANMGSSDFDDDDDGLSIMSDAVDEPMPVGSDDESDFDSQAESDQSLAEDEDSWGGIDSEQDADGASTPTLVASEDLEDRYAARQAKQLTRDAQVEAKKAKRLPVIAHGTLQEISDEEGVLQQSKSRIKYDTTSDQSESDSEEDESARHRLAVAAQPAMNPLGARFGRPAVSGVLEISDKTERLHAAREELAQLGRDIVAEPELGMNLLRRMLSLAAPVFNIPGAKKREGIVVDTPIRAMALLSLLAVFLDIIPGYRIRALSEAEKSQRATQAVLQQREFEEGLVNAYRRYLEICEEELKSGTPLASVALKCLCELAKEKGHFNFAGNIMEVICKSPGRRDFDASSQLCISTITHILSNDAVGQNSFEIVRLISRIVKMRSYLVHPAILSCLLALRFDSLGAVRASTDRIDRNKPSRVQQGKQNSYKGKGQFMNKKARKALKEKHVIEKEIQEAELAVKEEERSHNATESLKLLFALYFRILKLPVEQNSPLLPAALEGLARFSHLVNVDFFRDLLDVLKTIMRTSTDHRVQLLCVMAALELLTGQGEALNIDLTAFVTHLYALLLPLTVSTSIEEIPAGNVTSTMPKKGRGSFSRLSESELLFRSLRGIFLTSRLPNPPVRTLAFSKRLLIAAMHWPKSSAGQVLEFIRQLLTKERHIEAMLSTEDRRRDGVYRYDIADENLSNPETTVFWELAMLERQHFDEEVRSAASQLARWTKEQ